MPNAALADHVRALEEDAAFCVHALRALVRVTGGDHAAWLERLVSNPVAGVPRERVVLATLMDGKGKLLADVRVHTVGENGVLLEIPAADGERVRKRLDMYVINDDVVLAPLEDARFVSLLGPRACEAARALDLPVPDPGAAVATEALALAVRSRLGGVDGVDLVPVDARARDALVARLREGGIVEAGVDALDVVRVRHGVPWFERDMKDGVIPLEARLDDHVSITKGCYPGQEVVARITNLGQVARRLVTLAGDGGGLPAAGAELLGTGEHEGKTAGVLTSAVVDPSDGRVRGLGYARRAFWTPGTRLRAGEVALTVGAPGD